MHGEKTEVCWRLKNSRQGRRGNVNLGQLAHSYIRKMEYETKGDSFLFDARFFTTFAFECLLIIVARRPDLRCKILPVRGSTRRS